MEAEGEFGTLRLEVRNVPGPNPKTGRIVAPSVIRALQKLRALARGAALVRGDRD